ncbi:hypothetical protein FDUTEX481_02244 [Tolypothrix sp. PCC 7601]|nr:hypothetical protein FDUTEX481_02244 [Tolypothrix sp. PCC 7601]
MTKTTDKDTELTQLVHPSSGLRVNSQGSSVKNLFRFFDP